MLMSISLCFCVAAPPLAWRTPYSTRSAGDKCLGSSLSFSPVSSPSFTLILALGIKFSVGSYFPLSLLRSVGLWLPVPGESFAIGQIVALVQVISTCSVVVKFSLFLSAQPFLWGVPRGDILCISLSWCL